VRIASWNVNSVKARLDRLLAVLTRHQPDVLCLQELKTIDEAFPHVEVRAAGYHVALWGQRAYNGGAVLAKQAITDVRLGFGDGAADDEARYIEARVGPVTVGCAYVPNGRSVGSDSYRYKLAWLGRLRAFLDRTHRRDEMFALMGDFNCAPEDRDVARVEEWRATVLCDEEVRRGVREVVAFGLVDTFRKLHEEPGFYSWWDYRLLGFPKGNGLRIDQLYATEPLAALATHSFMDREERKGKLPSDHVPVVTDFAIGD
jgi:exodeoxyribonuclease III